MPSYTCNDCSMSMFDIEHCEKLKLRFIYCPTTGCSSFNFVWVVCDSSCKSKPVKYDPYDPDDRRSLTEHIRRCKDKHNQLTNLPPDFLFTIPEAGIQESIDYNDDTDSDGTVTVLVEQDLEEDDASELEEEEVGTERANALDKALELQKDQTLSDTRNNDKLENEKRKAVAVLPQPDNKRSKTNKSGPQDCTQVIQRDSSKNFFENGRKSISKLALTANMGTSMPSSCPEMNDSDTAKFFLIMKTVALMPKKTRRDLAAILKVFQDTFRSETKDLLERIGRLERMAIPDYPGRQRRTEYTDYQVNRRTEIPFLSRPIKEVKDLRNLVWDGSCSFLELLPHPTPILMQRDGVKERDSFVYISVIESIAHILQWDNLPNFDQIDGAGPLQSEVDQVTLLSQSSFARRKQDADVDYHFLLTTWQDGFQANYSSKKERLKPWIKTGTLQLKDKDSSKHSLPTVWKTTFPIAFGVEKGDKTLVEQKFFEECKILDRVGGNDFLIGAEKMKKRVRVTLVALKGDQPERRSMCGLVGINGNYGPAFGVIGNYKAIHSVLPSCDGCLKRLMNKQPRAPCESCLNWDALSDSPLSEYEVQFKSWPPDEPTHFKTQRVRFDKLCEVVDKAHDKLVSTEWTKSQAENYLTAHALSKETVDAVIECALGTILKDRAERNLVENVDQVNEWIKSEPHKYRKFEYPPIWTSGIDISQVPCIIMHLLFLGIAKCILGLVRIWLAATRRQAAFERSHDGVLDCIQKLDLPWCRALPYLQGTGGAWVSENYLAFARLMPWIYSHAGVVQETKELPVLPAYDTANKKCWKSQQCQQWLEERGIEVPNGVKARQNLVYQYHTSGTIPDLVSKDIRNEHCMLVVQACTAMIARLMVESTNEETIEEADRYVRIFLSYFHRFDQLMTKNLHDRNPIPQWISKSNFLSLPRVIEAMKEFGPPRLLFEGGINGEGILKYLKPFLSMGYRDNWNLNCMLRLLRSIAMAVMEGNDEIRSHLEVLNVGKGSSTDHSNFRTYRGLPRLIASFRDNKPISGFYTSQGKFGVCVRTKKVLHVYYMKPVEHQMDINCMAFHRWDMDFNNPGEMRDITVERHVLFLPELCKNGYHSSTTPRGIYTAIDDHWSILNRDGVLELPRVEDWPLDESNV